MLSKYPKRLFGMWILESFPFCLGEGGEENCILGTIYLETGRELNNYLGKLYCVSIIIARQVNVS